MVRGRPATWDIHRDAVYVDFSVNRRGLSLYLGTALGSLLLDSPAPSAYTGSQRTSVLTPIEDEHVGRFAAGVVYTY